MPETRSTALPRDVSPHDQRSRRGRRWGRFVRHFVVMLTAMYAGMLILYPVYVFVAGRLGHPDPTPALPVPSAGAMALAMTLPMAAWMRYHRHAWRPVAEMGAAMVVPTLVATLLHLAGTIPGQAVMGVAHVAMIPAMLAVMLLRFDEYADAPTIASLPEPQGALAGRDRSIRSTERFGESS